VNWGCRVNRRAFLLAPFLLPSKAEAAGVHLHGRLDSTQTEQSERIANFGTACAIVVNDQALWDAMVPLLNRDVQFSLFTVPA